MPLVKVNMLKGKDPEYKKALLDCIHDGMVDSLGIAEPPLDNWGMAGKQKSEG